MRKLIEIILLILLFVVVTSAQSQNIPQKINQPNDNKKISDSNDNNTAKQPSIQNPQPPPNLQKRTQDECYYCHQNPKEGWSKILQNPVAVFTGIIAIFTILLVVAGFIQVAISRDTARRQLRAYVFVKTIEIHNVADFIDKGEVVKSNARLSRPYNGPIAFLTIMNYGKTPADNMTCWANIYIRGYPLNSDLPTIQDSGKLVVAPNAKFHKKYMVLQPLTPQEMQQLRDGTSAIYVYGRITYTDAFGKDRYTNFRAYHNGLMGTIGIATAVVYYQEGNDYS